MIEKRENKAPKYFSKILIHEYFMAGFVIQAMIRLGLASKIGSWFCFYTIALALYFLLIYFGTKTLSSKINRLRLFANFFFMNFSFVSVKYVVPMLGLTTMDSTLASIDQFLISNDLSILSQNFYNRILTEIMSLGYLVHFVPFALASIYFAFVSDLDKSYRFYGGMFSVIGIGFIGYTLVPAQGPFVYYNGQYIKELSGYYITVLNNIIVKNGTAVYDVFPSLHTGVALYLLITFYSNSRKIFFLYLPLFIIIICATVYLRYHYLIDLICGSLLSAACYYLSKVSHKIISRGDIEHGTTFKKNILTPNQN